MKRITWTDDNLQELPRARQEAQKLGSRYFFPGIPCRKGHTAAFRTSNNRCLECMREETKNSAERRRRRLGMKIQKTIEPLVPGIRQHRLTSTGGLERRREYRRRQIYSVVYHEVKCDCGKVFWLRNEHWGKQKQCKHCDCKEKSKIHGLSKSNKGRLVYSARERSRKLGLDCDLVIEDINIPEYCPILGFALDTSIRGSQDHSPRLNAASIDRIDPKLGYTKDNIRIISHRANNLKKDGTAKEHIMVAEFMERMGVTE